MALGAETPDDEKNSDDDNSQKKQSKSLLANVYSTTEDSNYKDISSWSLGEDKVELVFDFQSTNNGQYAGRLRNTLGSFAGYESHEEFWNRMAYGLIQTLAINFQSFADPIEEAGLEVKGMRPILTQLDMTWDDAEDYFTADDTEAELAGDDILNFLDSHEDVRKEVMAGMAGLEGVEVDEQYLPDDEKESEETEENAAEADD